MSAPLWRDMGASGGLPWGSRGAPDRIAAALHAERCGRPARSGATSVPFRDPGGRRIAATASQPRLYAGRGLRYGAAFN